MYDKSDPRASLTAAKPASILGQTGLVADPQSALFYASAPQIDDAAGKTWLHRGHNFLVAYYYSCVFWRVFLWAMAVAT